MSLSNGTSALKAPLVSIAVSRSDQFRPVFLNEIIVDSRKTHSFLLGFRSEGNAHMLSSVKWSQLLWDAPKIVKPASTLHVIFRQFSPQMYANLYAKNFSTRERRKSNDPKKRR
jgi:hypothetical protein